MQIRLADITNLTDARYAAAEGFDWAGFNFVSGHPQFISALKAQEIKGWLSGPVYFGKFSGNDLSEIKGICAILHLDAIEVPMHQYQKAFYEAVPFLFLEAGSTNTEELLAFETAHPELFGTAAWVIHSPLKQKPGLPVFIHTETSDQMQAALASDPEGIDLAGTDEAQPGLSNWEVIDAMVTLLRG